VQKAGGNLSENIADAALWQQFEDAGQTISDLYEARDFGKAMREIMALADAANEYIAAQAPWSMAKEEGREQEVLDVCTMGINMFRALMTYLKPVLPELAEKTEAFLGEELSWNQTLSFRQGVAINKFKPMLMRIEKDKVDAMIEAGKEALAAVQSTAEGSGSEGSSPAEDSELAKEPICEEISFDDFAKVDLRIALIKDAQHVKGANKLLQLTLDLGGETRNVFSGIKSAYQPEELVGKLTVMVANLAPRKMKFGMSEGMVLAAGPGKDEIYLLEPHDGAKPGQRVM